MANSYQLDVKDSASVESWKADVQKLNEQTERTVKEAAQALAEFRNTAEGNVFEEVCNLSENVISSTVEVMKGMTELLNAVTKLVDTIKNVGKELASGVVSVVSKMF